MVLVIILGLQDDAAQIATLGEHYINLKNGIASIPINLSFTTFGKALRSKKKIFSILHEVIEKKKQGKQDKAYKDVVDFLLERAEDEKNLTQQQLFDNLLSLVFAAHDSTSAFLSNVVYILSQYPDIIEKLKEEQTHYTHTELTVQTLTEMPLLNAVLKEVLRYVPITNTIMRRISEDVTYKQWALPKGYKLQPQLVKLLQDKDTFQEPLKFDPSRFLEPRNEDQKTNFGYIPFGAGRHICLGKDFAWMEGRLFLALMTRRFTSWKANSVDSLMATPIFPHPLESTTINLIK